MFRGPRGDRAGPGRVEEATIASPCASCGRPAGEDDRFCGGCGAALTRPCVRCGRILPADAAFCTECGAATATHTGAPSSEDRRRVSVLFVDLIDFTPYTERSDPELVRETQTGFFA